MIPSRHVTDWRPCWYLITALEALLPLANFRPAIHREERVCMRASKATRLHRFSPGGAVTSETISPPTVSTDEVCTVASGNTAFTPSGRPLSPSQTTKKTSLTPRFFSSVSTASQNLADSPSPSPAHMPRMSLWPSRSTPIAA